MFVHNQATFNQGSYFISNLDRAFAPKLAWFMSRIIGGSRPGMTISSLLLFTLLGYDIIQDVWCMAVIEYVNNHSPKIHKVNTIQL
jgi:hypothetical protein